MKNFGFVILIGLVCVGVAINWLSLFIGWWGDHTYIRPAYWAAYSQNRSKFPALTLHRRPRLGFTTGRVGHERTSG